MWKLENGGKRYLYEILFLFVENTDLNIASIRNTLVYQSSNLTPWTTREIFMYPCTRLSDGIRIEMYGIISLLTDFFLSKNIHTVHLCFGNHIYIKHFKTNNLFFFSLSCDTFKNNYSSIILFVTRIWYISFFFLITTYYTFTFVYIFL